MVSSPHAAHHRIFQKNPGSFRRVGTGLSHFRGFVAESFRDAGRVEVRGEDILRILAVRGVAVPDAARQRITTCTDLAVLGVWFERAITAPTADAVFDES
ncbi:hypothetical protein ACK8N7_15975 [Streptomyces griseobrunneus]